MKKAMTIILSLTLALSVSACANQAQPNAGSAPPTGAATLESVKNSLPSTLPAANTAQSSSTEPEETSAQTATDLPGLKLGSWASIYERYSHHFQLASAQFDKFDDPSVALDLLSFVSGDIELAFTATFFEADADTAIPVAFGIFGYKDVKYQENGNEATVTAQTSEGKNTVLRLNYDGKNSGECVSTTDGVEDYRISICATETYTAKSYCSKDPEFPKNIHVVIYNNGDFDFGSSASADKVISLLGNAAAAGEKGFISDMEKKISVRDGKVLR